MCYSGWKSCESVPKLVEDYLAGKLKVDEFVTHSVPLDKINEAFDLMHAGKRSVNVFLSRVSFFLILNLHHHPDIHDRKVKFFTHKLTDSQTVRGRSLSLGPRTI